MKPLSIAAKLSEYVVSTNYEDIPADVRDKAKEVLLDAICCVIGGSQTEVGKICAKVMEDLGGARESTVIGIGNKIPAPNAAYANSMMANALDFDDTFPWGGHPGATTIPAALAVGEKMGADGRMILTSIILSYEISGRIGIAIRPSSERIKKVLGFGTWQTFGAMVAAGKVYGLTETELSHAFGIAGCNSPVPSVYKSALGESGNTMVKNNYGTASQVGILSTLLAREGFKGPVDIFEGDKGFWRIAGSDQCRFEEMTKGLGEGFKINEIGFKPYPSVRWNHSAIDGALEVVRKNELRLEDIDEIEVRSFSLACQEPFPNPEPKNLEEGVFSTPFNLGVAIMGIPPGPEWYAAEQLQNPDILAFAKKVRLVEDSEAEANYPRKQIAKVLARAKGKTFKAHIEYSKGESQNPFSKKELEHKLYGVASPSLGKETITRMIELINNVQELKDIGDFTRLVSLRAGRI